MEAVNEREFIYGDLSALINFTHTSSLLLFVCKTESKKRAIYKNLPYFHPVYNGPFEKSSDFHKIENDNDEAHKTQHTSKGI